MSRAGLSDEARFELGMAAAARERRNTPRHLVYLAGALVVVASIACLIGARSWARGGREARAVMAQQVAIGGLVQQYLDLKARAGGAETDPSGGFSTIVSTAERTSKASGIEKLQKPLEPQKADVRGGVWYRTWRYTKVQSPQAAPLMEWVRQMLEELPGLRVSSIKLTPPNERESSWTMDVTYAGVERTGGGT